MRKPTICAANWAKNPRCANRDAITAGAFRSWTRDPKGHANSRQTARITAIYSDSVQPATRQIIGRSGNYRFQKLGSGGTLVIEVDGVEVARKSVFDSTNTKQREDFDIYPPGSPEIVKPGVLNANFARPSNPKTAELYQKAGEAEKAKTRRKRSKSSGR